MIPCARSGRWGLAAVVGCLLLLGVAPPVDARRTGRSGNPNAEPETRERGGDALPVSPAEQRVLDRMNKRVRVRDAYPVIRSASKHGIQVHLNVIIGYPGERLRDFLATLKLLFVLRRSISVVSAYRLMLHRDLCIPTPSGEPRVVLGESVGAAISEDWSLEDGSNTLRTRNRRHWILVWLLRRWGIKAF